MKTHLSVSARFTPVYTREGAQLNGAKRSVRTSDGVFSSPGPRHNEICDRFKRQKGSSLPLLFSNASLSWRSRFFSLDIHRAHADTEGMRTYIAESILLAAAAAAMKPVVGRS
jgi:hypothetical protein